MIHTNDQFKHTNINYILNLGSESYWSNAMIYVIFKFKIIILRTILPKDQKNDRPTSIMDQPFFFIINTNLYIIYCLFYKYILIFFLLEYLLHFFKLINFCFFILIKFFKIKFYTTSTNQNI